MYCEKIYYKNKKCVGHLVLDYSGYSYKCSKCYCVEE